MHRRFAHQNPRIVHESHRIIYESRASGGVSTKRPPFWPSSNRQFPRSPLIEIFDMNNALIHPVKPGAIPPCPMPAIRISLLVVFAGLATAAAALKPIDLSGQWKFAPDESDAGLAASPEQWKFPETIQLPGQVAAQEFGEIPSIRTQWTDFGWRYPELFKEWQADDNFKMPFFLQPPRRFVAPAWYQKEVEIPADWNGKHALLHLERAHWETTAWVNGKEIGKSNSLGTPHEFDLGPLPPGKHTLTLRIDNRIVDVNPGMIARASAASHSTSRFPVFWNEFNDWVPDIDYGGNLQLALQLMLLQSEPGPTGKLRLLPTWPKDWDMSFKLHAPGKTFVECIYQNGRIASLKVSPESRRSDLIPPEGISAP
jgi:hypothetical protein